MMVEGHAVVWILPVVRSVANWTRLWRILMVGDDTRNERLGSFSSLEISARCLRLRDPSMARGGVSG
jgi:hypothetical protein